MKELSIEEKAKRYDEAIERAKTYHNDYTQDIMEDIFPELKESEGLRIIKAIKYGLDHVFTNNTTVFEVTKEQCLSWLEKQGEQKVSVVDFKAEDWYVSKVDGKIYNAKFMEQNSCKKTTRREEIEKAAFSTSGIIEQTDWFIKGAEWADEHPCCNWLEKQSEQKSQRMVSAEAKEAMYNKPAWSKEDERYLSYAIHAVEDMLGDNGKNIVAWLKSLKERYTWKPSDEQLIALRQIISGCSYDIEPLVELETKLKEL